MSKTPISSTILNALQKQGLRQKLLKECESSVPPEIIPLINQATRSNDSETLTARALTARIMASGLSADGSFNSHLADKPWLNFGSSVLDYVKKHSNTGDISKSNQYQNMLNRLVRCVSLPLALAQVHIFSLARQLIDDGVQLNFDRLYWDLINWDNPERHVKLDWASGFCELNDSIRLS